MTMEATETTSPDDGTPDETIVITRQIDLSDHLYLRDHTLGGAVSDADTELTALPLVPLAMSLEFMAEAAAALAPDLALTAIEGAANAGTITLANAALTGATDQTLKANGGLSATSSTLTATSGAFAATTAAGALLLDTATVTAGTTLALEATTGSLTQRRGSLSGTGAVTLQAGAAIAVTAAGGAALRAVAVVRVEWIASRFLRRSACDPLDSHDCRPAERPARRQRGRAVDSDDGYLTFSLSPVAFCRWLSLLVAQRDDRVDVAGAAGRETDGDERDEGERSAAPPRKLSGPTC